MESYKYINKTLILLGNEGSGKTSLFNFLDRLQMIEISIKREDVFGNETDYEPTKECKKNVMKNNRDKIKYDVFDTPGINSCDDEINEEIAEKIVKIVKNLENVIFIFCEKYETGKFNKLIGKKNLKFYKKIFGNFISNTNSFVILTNFKMNSVDGFQWITDIKETYQKYLLLTDMLECVKFDMHPNRKNVNEFIQSWNSWVLMLEFLIKMDGISINKLKYEPKKKKEEMIVPTQINNMMYSTTNIPISTYGYTQNILLVGMNGCGKNSLFRKLNSTAPIFANFSETNKTKVAPEFIETINGVGTKVRVICAPSFKNSDSAQNELDNLVQTLKNFNGLNLILFVVSERQIFNILKEKKLYGGEIEQNTLLERYIKFILTQFRKFKYNILIVITRTSEETISKEVKANDCRQRLPYYFNMLMKKCNDDNLCDHVTINIRPLSNDISYLTDRRKIFENLGKKNSYPIHDMKVQKIDI